MSKKKYPVKAQLEIEKDSRLGIISLAVFGLLIFGFVLVPVIILRADGIINGFIR